MECGGGGVIIGVGGGGTTGRLAEGNHWRGREGQGEEFGGDADGRQFKDWGVHGFFGKPEGTKLGSTNRRVEWGSIHAGSQCTRSGRFSDMDTGKLGMERFGRGEGDSDHVTEHQVGAGGGAGGGASRPTARERQHWSLSGD